MALSALPALARSPRHGVPVVLARGTLGSALALVALSTALSALVALRVSREVRIDDLLFGEGRSPLVDYLLASIGTERTAVIVYLVQRSFDAVVFATAATPIFLWLLGSSAVHAASRLAGIRRPYAPLLVLFGYAAALTRVPADLASLLLGVGTGAGPRLATVVSALTLVWFGALAFEGIRAHHGVAGGRAFAILCVAVGLFYLVPLALIVAAAVAIVLAGVVLEYF